MSGAALGWAKAQKAPSMIAKAVLICLADYADADGVAWPAIPNLAKEVQVSDRTVQRALTALAEAGLLEIERRTRKDGGWTSNGYRLALQQAAEAVTPGDRVSPAPRHVVTTLVTLQSPANDPQENLLPSDEGKRRARSKTKPSPSLSPEAAAIWAAAPKIARQRSSQDEVAVALLAAVGRGHDPARVLAGLKAAYASTVFEGQHAKGVHRLIEHDRWANFLDDPAPAAAPAVFDGPELLRAEVVSRMGEAFATAWIDPCRWDNDSRTLFARNGFAQARLQRDLGPWFAHCKVRVEAAPSNDHHHQGAAA